MELNPAPIPPGVEALSVASDHAAIQQPFYVVSSRKFLLLAFATFGVYQIYWFYKNWSLQKALNRESILPAARAIFSIFFVHSLFNRVDEQLDKVARDYRWAPGSLALAFVVAMIAGNIFDRLAGTSALWSYSDLALVLLSLIDIYILFQAQQAINCACGDASGSTNNTLTKINIAWLVGGGVIWMLALLGIYLQIWHPALLEEPT